MLHMVTNHLTPLLTWGIIFCTWIQRDASLLVIYSLVAPKLLIIAAGCDRWLMSFQHQQPTDDTKKKESALFFLFIPSFIISFFTVNPRRWTDWSDTEWPGVKRACVFGSDLLSGKTISCVIIFVCAQTHWCLCSFHCILPFFQCLTHWIAKFKTIKTS